MFPTWYVHYKTYNTQVYNYQAISIVKSYSLHIGGETDQRVANLDGGNCKSTSEKWGSGF